jgi:hypothetical protein
MAHSQVHREPILELQRQELFRLLGRLGLVHQRLVQIVHQLQAARVQAKTTQIRPWNTIQTKHTNHIFSLKMAAQR